MSAISEHIVREYFETLGFCVLQPAKHQVVARAKRPEEEIDLLAWNPNAAGAMPEPGVWKGVELRRVRALAVAVWGWHTERFSPSALIDSPEVLRIGREEVRREAARRLGVEDVATAICLPALPASADLRRKTLAIIREAGISGVLLFRPVLLELAAAIRPERAYEKSDVMQVLRILKAHDLLRDPQLELFRSGTRGKKVVRRMPRKRADAAEAAADEPAAGGAEAPAGETPSSGDDS